MSPLLRFLTGVFLVLASAHARAAATSVEFCVTYETDYIDADAEGLDDYVKDNEPVPARGVQIRILVLGFPLHLLTTPATGDDRGCATVSLSDAAIYEVQVLRKSVVSGHTIELQTDSGGLRWYVADDDFTPDPVSDSVDIDIPASKYNDVMRAAEWTVHRGVGGASGKNFEFRMGNCGNDPNLPFSCYGSGGDKLLWIETASLSYKSKYVIAHEMGHQVMDMANHLDGFTNDTSYNGTNCPAAGSHEWNSIEYQSAAAVEGFAQFIAVRTFNAHDNTEGWARNNGIDPPFQVEWDRESLTVEQRWFSVEAGPCQAPDANGDCSAAGENGLGDHDYAAAECTTIAGRATEYDYVRALWDLHTNTAVQAPLTTIVAWVEKWNVHTWEGTDSGNANDMPAARIADAAEEIDFDTGTLLDVWDSIAHNNGVDR